MERTEEDKIIQAGIKVILGGKEYSIAPQVIRDSREWKKKVIKLVAPLSHDIKVTDDDPKSFERVFTKLLVDMPDQVIDLFFDYTKDLDRDEMEGVATDAEVAEAFAEVMKVAFPLAQTVVDTLAKLSQ